MYVGMCVHTYEGLRVMYVGTVCTVAMFEGMCLGMSLSPFSHFLLSHLLLYLFSL
jgi:hypothetical protein